jgi:hypothetical protein
MSHLRNTEVFEQRTYFWEIPPQMKINAIRYFIPGMQKSQAPDRLGGCIL